MKIPIVSDPMSSFPCISIVTPSFNQGRYLAETLQSLVDQGYPNLEVIIQDGVSTDSSVAIAEDFTRRYPTIFKLFVEKDGGQADALNRGFARARGDILGFLNSDDTLYSGCLQSVAREIDPARNRMIVFGRCLFTGEDSPYVGVEHPAEYYSHFEYLAIWKRGYNTMPQPSVFWHRKVWEKCGGLNIMEHHALDYDLFCRFSRNFHFHRVDELWSTYRMHAASKSAQRTEAEVLHLSIKVSRRYWGSWWSPLRLRCEVSYWLHNHHLHEHARHYAREAEKHWERGHYLRSIAQGMMTSFYSPRMAWYRLASPALIRLGLSSTERLLFKEKNPQVFTGQYGDNWIGPVFKRYLDVPPTAEDVIIVLEHVIQREKHHRTISPVLKINGQKIQKLEISENKQFHFRASVTKYRNKNILIEIETNEYFIPRIVHETTDDRKLSVLLLAVKFTE